MAFVTVSKNSLVLSFQLLQERAATESKQIQDVIRDTLYAAFQYTPPYPQSPHQQARKNQATYKIQIDDIFYTILMQYYILRKESLNQLISGIIAEQLGLEPRDRVWHNKQIRILCRQHINY